MHPPTVDDSTVRTVIRELREEGGWPSGVRVRTELARRFGARGGTTRIYRLLAALRASESGAVSEVERAALQRRAELAELREEAHQRRWLTEIDRLRTRLTEAERVAAQAQALETQNRELRRRLQSAEVRLAELERRLEPGGEGSG